MARAVSPRRYNKCSNLFAVMMCAGTAYRRSVVTALKTPPRVSPKPIGAKLEMSGRENNHLLIVGNPVPIYVGAHLLNAARSLELSVELCDSRTALLLHGQ